MQLLPRDLGTDRYLAILRKRLTPVTPGGNATNTVSDTVAAPPVGRGPRRRGMFRRMWRYWVQDLSLDEEVGEKVAALAWNGTAGTGVRVGIFISTIYLMIGALIAFLTGATWIGVMLSLLWGGILALTLTSLRKTLKTNDSKPLTAAEVEAMLPNARGRLDRAYLNLVLDTLRQEVPSASAQNDIRAALRYLGTAIHSLPADPIAAVDPLLLRKQAQDKRRESNAESDSVIRASLLREADALERRAAVAEQNHSARRVSALRREARTQMDALRSVLVAFGNTSHADTATVAHLSEAVQRASIEAQAVAIARRELEDDEIERLFGASVPTQSAPLQQPVTQPTQTQPTAPPQQQVVNRSGPWWRNGGGS